MILTFPRMHLGQPTDEAVHAWTTRPFALEESHDKRAIAAMCGRLKSGVSILSRRFWKARISRGFIINPFVFSTSDPNFASVTLLMHMDDTGLTDVKGNTVTINGTTARSATQSKFGGYSCDFGTAAAANYLSLPQVSGYDVASTDWTLEGWLYMTASTGDQQWVHYGKDTVVGGADISYGVATFTTGGIGLRLFLYVSTTQTNRDFSMPTINAWHHWHCGLTAAGHLIAGLDGTNLGSGGVPGTPNTPASRTMKLGRYHTGDNRPVRGYQDDIRLTKGVCRYTSLGGSYTVPTAAFPDS